MGGDRTLTQARREQGYKSQEHLDAFYAYYDHTHTTCEECKKPGPAHWSEADASWQPTMAEHCKKGKALQRAWDSFSPYARH